MSKATIIDAENIILEQFNDFDYLHYNVYSSRKDAMLNEQNKLNQICLSLSWL